MTQVFAYKWVLWLAEQSAQDPPALSAVLPPSAFSVSASSETYETKAPEGHPGAAYIGPKREIFEITSGEQQVRETDYLF